MNWIKKVPETNWYPFLFGMIWIFWHMEGCQMVWRNGWFSKCSLQEAMCAAQSRALSFWTLNFLSIFSRLLDVLEIVFFQVHLSVSAHRYFFPEKPLQDNRESYARKGYWRKWRKGFSYRNILKFRQFLMQFCYFCTEKISPSPGRVFRSVRKVWTFFPEFFSPWLFLLQRLLKIVFLLRIISVAFDAKGHFQDHGWPGI